MKAFSIVALIFAVITVVLDITLVNYFIKIELRGGDIAASLSLLTFGMLQLAFCIACVVYFNKRARN